MDLQTSQQTHSLGTRAIPDAFRVNLPYFAMWLIIPFCSFTSHTIAPVPPTLVLLLIAFVLLVHHSTRIRFSGVLVVPLLSLLYYTVTQPMLAPFSRYMGAIFSIFYLLVIVAYGHKVSMEQRERLTRNFIVYSLFLLIVECIWRMSHPNAAYAEFENVDVRWIYQYKFGGLMYADSNAVGIHIVVLFFFILYREDEKGERWTITKIILLVLLAFTFSRAAWAGTALGWIYFRFLRNRSARFYMINAIALSVVMAVAYNLFLADDINSDLSFMSKLDIFHAVLDYFSNASPLSLLLGVGFSNSMDVLGIYAHNFFMVILIESGIIGLVLILLQFLAFFVYTGKRALIILLPFIITTLSSTIIFLPFFYVVMALMVLDRKEYLSSTHEEG